MSSVRATVTLHAPALSSKPTFYSLFLGFFFFFGLSHRDSLTSSWDENVIETEGPSAHGMWPCRGETS